MVLLLVLLTLVVFAVVAIQMRQHQKATAKSLASGGLTSSLYFHPGHSWVNFQPTGIAKIGIDRFLRDLVGQFDEIIVPSKGRVFRQGQPILTIVSKGKQLHIPSPIDGVVVDSNLSPSDGIKYETDHMITIRPTRIKANLLAMTNYVGSEGWLALEYERLRDFVASYMNPFKGMGITMADGGQFNKNLYEVLEKMDKPTLRTFNTEFLHC
jgi:hypothetical protein